jgi:hypothetical protein
VVLTGPYLKSIEEERLNHADNNGMQPTPPSGAAVPIVIGVVEPTNTERKKHK